MEKSPGEQNERALRHLDDPGTFEAIAQIEGPEWVALQDALANDQRDEVMYETSFQRALDRFRAGKSVINGTHFHKWVVDRDGVVRFVVRQAGDDDTPERRELLERVKILGFGLTP